MCAVDIDEHRSGAQPRNRSGRRKKANGVVMTSSPAPTPHDINASTNASEPDAQPIENLVWQYRATPLPGPDPQYPIQITVIRRPDQSPHGRLHESSRIGPLDRAAEHS